MPQQNTFTFATILTAGLGCGLMGGVFFAFSTFVMQGLARLPAIESVHAMQSINEMAGRTLFGALFILTPLACVVSLVVGWPHRRDPVGQYILAGGLTYLFFGLLLTLVFNIPLNNQLAEVSTQGADYAAEWHRFFTPWMAWNHLRTAGSIAATVFFLLALRRM